MIVLKNYNKYYTETVCLGTFLVSLKKRVKRLLCVYEDFCCKQMFVIVFSVCAASFHADSSSRIFILKFMIFCLYWEYED